MALREANPTSSSSPLESEKSCMEQPGGGMGADAGAGSSGAAGHADAFLHLDQTFSLAH